MPVSKYADERDELVALITVARSSVSKCFSRAMKHLEAVEGDNNPSCLDEAEKELADVARLTNALRDYQRLYRDCTPANPRKAVDVETV